MTSAPVGFQCPACVKEGRQSVRRIKSSTAEITKLLIGICVGIFAVETLTGNDFSFKYGLAGYPITEWGQYYRFISAIFLHGGVIHILFNMLILWQLGSVLEPALGKARFALLYFVAGLGGGLASFMFNDPMVISVGASGAIFGLMGAYVVLARRVNINQQQVVSLIAINLIIGFVLPGIDWHAHLGGLAAGAALTALMTAKR
jgi:membrane associated rhomboid family serine protease